MGPQTRQRTDQSNRAGAMPANNDDCLLELAASWMTVGCIGSSTQMIPFITAGTCMCCAGVKTKLPYGATHATPDTAVNAEPWTGLVHIPHSHSALP